MDDECGMASRAGSAPAEHLFLACGSGPFAQLFLEYNFFVNISLILESVLNDLNPLYLTQFAWPVKTT